MRVIAGEALGAKAVIDTRTPIMFLHYMPVPGARVIQPAPPSYTVFAYVFAGSGTFGSNERGATAHQMVRFANDGDAISINSSPDRSGDLEVLVSGGIPLHEPVARYGPFVMNTKQEIAQAIEDYQSGKMGQIAASPEEPRPDAGRGATVTQSSTQCRIRRTEEQAAARQTSVRW